jgi:putative FmdB family regulatory protein
LPTYEYTCKSCGSRLETVQKFTDDALTECPTCGGELRKVFGNVGIVFKGSGFYKNDSRSASEGSKAPAAAITSPESTSAPAADTTSTSTTTPSAPSAPSPASSTPAANPSAASS